MTNKDKLIELICSTEYGNGSLIGNNFQKGFIEKIADHLIANGVTVQKWIPVSERLPEIDDTYLVVVKFKYDFEKEYNIDTDVAIYNPYDGGYIDDCWDTFTDWDEGQQYLHVTHWMPLPEPPKGE